MANECFYLGPTPVEEDCVSIYGDLLEARKQVRKYIDMLETRFPHNTNAFFKIIREEHDAGTYYEAGIFYPENDREAMEYALFVERNLPLKWDETVVLEFLPSDPQLV